MLELDNYSKEIVSVKDKMSKVLRACRIVSQRHHSNPPAHIHSEEPVFVRNQSDLATSSTQRCTRATMIILIIVIYTFNSCISRY